MSSGPLWIKNHLSCAQDKVATSSPADDSGSPHLRHTAPATKPQRRGWPAWPWGPRGLVIQREERLFMASREIWTRRPGKTDLCLTICFSLRFTQVIPWKKLHIINVTQLNNSLFSACLKTLLSNYIKNNRITFSCLSNQRHCGSGR